MAHSPAPDQGIESTRNALYRRITLRLIPFIFICYLFNYLDRVNVGFAKLQMLDALKFSETVYGLGAGIFFIGYVLCGLPSNLALNRFGPRRWIALIDAARENSARDGAIITVPLNCNRCKGIAGYPNPTSSQFGVTGRCARSKNESDCGHSLSAWR